MSKLNFDMFDEIITIADLLKGSKFEEEKLKPARPHIKKLQKAINVPEKELIYFCVIFRLSLEHRLNLQETRRYPCNLFLVSDFLDISTVTIVKDFCIFTDLYRRKLYCRCSDCGSDLDSFLEDYLLIPRNTFESVVKNEQFIFYEKEPWEYRKEFIGKILNLDTASSTQIFQKIKQLEKEYKNFDFIKNCSAIKKDKELFYILCAMKERKFYYGNYNLNNDIKRNFTDGSKIISDLVNDNSYLLSEEYINVVHSDILDDAGIYLTRKGMDIFFGEGQGNSERKSNEYLISPETIKEKALYYSDCTKEQISVLQSSLENKKFKELKERLAKENMNTGICVLFYGDPGTGKTETVMQIAKSTGRKVFHVDISQQKSCWFGESEKTIKKLFTIYKMECGCARIKHELIPILLFNEADAIISKRKDINSSNVAQTENAIQNIILEELENFDGIMIATTNLVNNFDKAFERRFLFKIKFEKPTIEIASKIWQEKLQDLNYEEATELAVAYDFSGGEIDNISRKVIVDKVITGETPTFEKIKDFCGQEKLELETAAKIGFCG